MKPTGASKRIAFRAAGVESPRAVEKLQRLDQLCRTDDTLGRRGSGSNGGEYHLPTSFLFRAARVAEEKSVGRHFVVVSAIDLSVLSVFGFRRNGIVDDGRGRGMIKCPGNVEGRSTTARLQCQIGPRFNQGSCSVG